MTWERQRAYDYDEGAHDKAIEAARNLLKMNLGTIEQIAQVQGLSIEEVQELAKEASVSVAN